MSETHITPTLSLKELLLSSQVRLAKQLGRRTLSQVETSPVLPELAAIIEDAESLPEVDIDRGLKLLVDHDRWPDSYRDNPEALPAPYTKKIADLAMRVAAREPEQLTIQAIGALGRAADDTGDHDLLEIALEKASAMNSIDTHVRPLDPPYVEALRYAVSHDATFRESLKIVESQPSSSDTEYDAESSKPKGLLIPSGGFDRPTDDNEKQDYEFLYSYDVPNPLAKRRPQTNDALSERRSA
ncbi:MAG: hypothetical protein WBK76_01420 [Candidatus Saccharimonadales bacterium]